MQTLRLTSPLATTRPVVRLFKSIERARGNGVGRAGRAGER